MTLVLKIKLPFTVRITDANANRVMIKFFYINLLTGRYSSTSEAIFESINEQFEKHGISWDNVLG